MSLSRIVVAVSAAGALAAASPAFAQHRGGGGGHASTGGGHATAAPRAAAPHVASAPRPSAPRVSAVARPVAVPRVSTYRAPIYAAQRGGAGRVVPRGGFRGGPVVVAPVRFIRPYYAFRPRFSIGFGIWAGFPIAYAYPYYYPYYPYAYPYPYPYYDYGYSYPYPPAYGAYPPPPPPQPQYGGSAYPSQYPPQPSGSVGVQQGPANQNMGGLSFEITPGDAQVFVDGVLVGAVSQFTPSSQPLGLTPGRHRIEIKAPGYQTLDFDADIVAGQVIPYQGVMQR